MWAIALKIGGFFVSRYGVYLLWIPVALAVAAYGAKVYYNIYQRGAQSVRTELNEQVIRTQHAWNQIDSRSITFNDAISGLRQRVGR